MYIRLYVGIILWPLLCRDYIKASIKSSHKIHVFLVTVAHRELATKIQLSLGFRIRGSLIQRQH